ncbi:T9SS type A sorting domain-containing protein [Chryseobacterium sp. ISL-6]|uniref:T9SS type A sorting domain-containing protein n=1 Tax=Chryseobacterium sp. ISL-6 TaxID=2819143 RepID=UPI001BE8B682|nr:T9SS type A sorting domain-containing protein [Chryseobacterium sp. ISL-6]MBT2620219.1 T9SS type A sorting domain-containing protein [Chryseobacterium sp. ISL-6]
MKKILLSCLLMISMALNAQINLGMGSIDVGAAPISTYYGYSYVQQIFSKQEINADAAGNITGLSFYLDPTKPIVNSLDWVVYLGHTTKSSFVSDSDWLPVSQLTQVYAGTVTNINGVVTVTFPTPFPYNNIDNLVVAVDENSQDYDDNSDEVMNVYPSAPNSTLYFRNDGTNPNPSFPPIGNLASYKSVITINGLTKKPIPACPLIVYPTNNTVFVPLLPTIIWNAVAGATGYKVSIGTTPGGTDIVNQQSVTSGSFALPTLLSPDTMYYLRVVSVAAAGESSGCSEITFKSAPPLPINDNCIGAKTLTVNSDLDCGVVTSGYTLGATPSGLTAAPCYGDPDDDVWFKFVATKTSHKISLLNVTSIGTFDDDDIYFQVLSGTCGVLSSVLCSDATSSIVSGLTIGQTYYVRVYSYYDTGSNQSFDICVGSIPPPPVNDECSGALVASAFPYNYVQSDGGGATNNAGFITACDNGMNDGTWFTFVGDGDIFNIAVSMPPGSDFDPQVDVYSGTCGNLSCEGTVDSMASGESEYISVATVPGTTYYINVGHYSQFTDELEGTFTIDISKGTSQSDKNALGASKVIPVTKGNGVYPNPFTDVLNISDSENVKSVMVSDFAGRVVKTIDNPDSVIHLNGIQSGLYLVTMTMKNGSKQTVKVIKK